MIQRQLKLKLTKKQEKQLNDWLFILTGVYNWVIRKIELDANDKISRSYFYMTGLVRGHSKKIGIPVCAIRGTIKTAYTAWERCFKRLSKRPKLKGQRNQLNNILFMEDVRILNKKEASVPCFGIIKFHKQEIPIGKIKCGRIIKKESGWYLCLFIDSDPNKIPVSGFQEIGIDPGYSHLITTSTGEKIEHPRELQQKIKRIGQAQRGNRKKLVAILNEKISNQRKDRNHKLSRKLVSENKFIAFSKDNLRVLSQSGFGKSVLAAAHGQLRTMLSYKSRLGGRKYVEVKSRNSTRTCSCCGALTGPQGRAGLSVRQWKCSCGAEHDRDVNAAMNTLIAGLGTSHECVVRRFRNPKEATEVQQGQLF